MRSIVVESFGDADVMQVKNIPELNAQGNQIKIEVKAAGVNPVDTYIRSGVYPQLPDLPYTPGSDAAGVIVQVGDRVEGFKPGQRVYTLRSLSGCYAEQVLVNQDQIFALPDCVSFSQGAALGVPYSTAFFALNYRAHALPGETVLIHGASGAVGLAAVEIARSNGLKVIGTAGTPEGVALLKLRGVTAALNHREDNYLDAVAELTDGRGVDLILEMLANVNLNQDLKHLAHFGRVVVIGSRGPIEIDPRETMSKNSTIMGMSLFNASPEILKRIHAVIYAGLEDGRFNPLIHSELPLAAAPDAHRRVMTAGINGKVVLLP